MSGNTFLRLDMADFETALQTLTSRIQHLPDDCKLAVARSINRTLQSIAVEAIRAAREKYTPKAEDLGKALRKRNAGANNLVGTLEFHGRMGRPLVIFKPSPAKVPDWRGVPVARRRPKAGVSSLIKRGGSRKVYAKEGAKPFLATMKSGHKGLFVRQTSGKLKQLFGPSSIQVLGGDEARDRLQAKAQEVFPKRLAHEIDALLTGVSRGRGR